MSSRERPPAGDAQFGSTLGVGLAGELTTVTAKELWYLGSSVHCTYTLMWEGPWFSSHETAFEPSLCHSLGPSPLSILTASPGAGYRRNLLIQRRDRGTDRQSNTQTHSWHSQTFPFP